MTLNKQAQVIISDIRLKHGSGDAYAPIIRWDEFEAIAGALESAEKRVAELEARTVTLPKELNSYGGVKIYRPSDVIEALRDAGIKIKGE